MKFKIGAKVQWKWMGRFILGQVEEVFTEPIFKTIKGKKIKRNASVGNPAYFVKSEAGNFALKLEKELSTVSPVKKSKSVPKMFQ
jgi:hypothetical protein